MSQESDSLARAKQAIFKPWQQRPWGCFFFVFFFILLLRMATCTPKQWFTDTLRTFQLLYCYDNLQLYSSVMNNNQTQREVVKMSHDNEPKLKAFKLFKVFKVLGYTSTTILLFVIKLK